MITEEAARFCEARWLTAYLEWAMMLAKDAFQDAESTANFREDVMGGAGYGVDEHVVVEIQDPSDPYDGSQAFFGLVERWSQMNPWIVSRDIRFGYTSVTPKENP